jgi:hypothetical protein
MWGHVYRWAGGTDPRHFANAGMRDVVGKLHGYVMPLDLGNWHCSTSFGPATPSSTSAPTSAW